MSRNRAMNWERAKRETANNASRVSGPDRIYVRQRERTAESWKPTYSKWNTDCCRCADDILAGERCFMAHNPVGPPNWLFLHELCRE